jgi:uncharacterized protein YuzE
VDHHGQVVGIERERALGPLHPPAPVAEVIDPTTAE